MEVTTAHNFAKNVNAMYLYGDDGDAADAPLRSTRVVQAVYRLCIGINHG